MTSPASSDPARAGGPAAACDASWGAPAVGGDPRPIEMGAGPAGAAVPGSDPRQADADAVRTAGPVPGGDPRQPDTDAVRALLDQAEAMTSGAVRLPAMTAAELCVLGAMTTSLIDASAWSWWTSAPPARRQVLRGAAWRFLAHRQLITPDAPGRQTPGQAGRVRVTPAAALIVAGRTRAAFIVLCREGVTGEPERTRMYGIADQHRGLRAVLIEDATPGQLGWAGPAYEFGLASPAAAGRALARWATTTGSAPPLRPRPRLIDLYLPGAGARLPAGRIAVRATGNGWQVQRDSSLLSAGHPLAWDEDGLTGLFTDTLTGACP